MSVNRKLTRLLRPGMGAYFFIMAAFCAAALLLGHYWLAVGEMAVTVVVFLLYILDRTHRERQIQRYIQSASNTLEASSGGEAPLPAVMIRLGDGDIVWGNHRFSELTGYADTMTGYFKAQLDENETYIYNAVMYASENGYSDIFLPEDVFGGGSFDKAQELEFVITFLSCDSPFVAHNYTTDNILKGNIEQFGTPEDIIERPASDFVKDFIIKQLTIKKDNIFKLFSEKKD